MTTTNNDDDEGKRRQKESHETGKLGAVVRLLREIYTQRHPLCRRWDNRYFSHAMRAGNFRERDANLPAVFLRKTGGDTFNEQYPIQPRGCIEMMMGAIIEAYKGVVS